MAALHQRYPDDVDATAFYALSLLGTAHQGRDFATYMRSAALLEEVFPTHPRHPGVLHYLIHSYDDPIHAPLGLRAARLYGGVAPNAGHALHMTSHIFVALGLWDDVIAANEQAMRVVNQQRAAPWPVGEGLRPLPRAGCTTPFSRSGDSTRRNSSSTPAGRWPWQLSRSGAPLARGRFVRQRLRGDARFPRIETGSMGRRGPLRRAEGRLRRDRGFTQAYGEALVAAGADLPSLRAAAARLRERQKDLLAEIEQKKETDRGDRQRAEILVQQIDALERLREGKKDEGIALLRKAAEAESAMPLEFGPPVIEKPTFELLGDELLALGRHAEAEQAYRSALARAPGRTRSLQGLLRAEQALGKTDAAEQTRAQLQRYVRTAPAAR